MNATTAKVSHAKTAAMSDDAILRTIERPPYIVGHARFACIMLEAQRRGLA